MAATKSGSECDCSAECMAKCPPAENPITPIRCGLMPYSVACSRTNLMACCKSFRTPSVEKIMCTEIISETDYADSDYGFVPNYFVDISEYIDEKIRILAIYNSEVKESPFPRNEEAIRGLAKYRGASCYAHYAEAYRVLKIIER